MTTHRNADGSITVTGTAEGAHRYWNANDTLGLTLEAGTYTLSGMPELRLLVGGGVYKTGTFTLTEKTTFKNLTFFYANNEVVNTTLYPQLEINSTATAYEKYTAVNFTIDLDGTRYGGTLDVLTGVMTVTKVIFDKPTITHSLSSTTKCYRFWIPTQYSLVGGQGISNISTCCTFGQRGEPYTFFVNPNDADYFYFDVPKSAVSGTTAEYATAWILANEAQFVWTIAEPFTIQLTPQQLSTLLGDNILWATTGDSTVTLRLAAGDMAYIDDAPSDGNDYVRKNNSWHNVSNELNAKAAAIHEEVSGSVVSFFDGSDLPVESLTVNVESVQDLNGYSNPWPAGGGKNLLNPNIYPTMNKNGIVVTPNSDGILKVTGTPSTTTWYYCTTGNVSYKASSILTLPAGSYTFSIRNKSDSAVAFSGSLSIFYWYEADADADRKVVQKNNSYMAVTLTVEETVYIIPCFTIGSETNLNEDVYLQLESGSTKTDYAPYSNVCPISGWSEAKVIRTGKNLIGNDAPESGTHPDVNVSWVKHEDGSITLNGTCNGSNKAITLIYRNTYTLPPVGTYKLTGITSYNGQLRFNTMKNGSVVNRYNYSTYGPVTVNITEDIDTFTLSLFFANGAEYNNVTIYPMLVMDGEDTSTYVPYQGTEFTIPFGQTVYGATLNVLTGVLTVTHGVHITDSETPWSYRDSGYFQLAISGLVSGSDIITNVYPKGGTGVDKAIRAVTGYVRLTDTSYNGNLTNFMSDMVAYPLTIVYPLATPQTIQLTPQQLTTLLGKNNIWADTGDISVRYRADTKLYIDQQIGQAVRGVRSIIAGEETEMKATKNYLSGDYIIVGDDLLKATANIASGTNLVLNTNVTKTTVGEQLKLALS